MGSGICGQLRHLRHAVCRRVCRRRASRSDGRQFLGGGGGSYLRGLYRRAWNLIDAKYVPLGTNPF